jgi:hypothetical protein
MFSDEWDLRKASNNLYNELRYQVHCKQQNMMTPHYKYGLRLMLNCSVGTIYLRGKMIVHHM